MRRRAHAPGRPPAPRHGPRRPAVGAPALRRAALDRPRRHPRAARGPTIPTSLATGTWFGAATSTRWWPSGAVKAGRRGLDRRRGGRAAGRRRPGDRRGDPARRCRPSRCGPATWWSPTASNSRFGRALGTARDRTYPLGHGGAGLLHQPVPRRAVDREPPRPARPRRQPPPGLRLDLPGRRRHRERRRRAAVHVRGVEGRQHQHADGRVRRHRAGALGHRARDVVRRRRPAASCRPAGRSRRTSGPTGWWSATPPVR